MEKQDESVVIWDREMSRIIMNRISKGHHDISKSCESIDAMTDLIESDADTNDAKERWVKAIRSYNSLQLKEMLNEGSVSTTWTYKTAKKLKHIHLVNSTSDSTIGKISLIPGSINNNEITCLDVAISTDDTELLDLYWSNMSADELQVSQLNHALALACRVTASNELVIKLLTMGAEANHIHADIPVIILAVWTEKTAAVEYMLDSQPNIINCMVLNDSVINKHKFEGQSTPLHHACATGNYELVTLLMQRGGDLTSHDNENGDVFFYAKNESICNTLLKEYLARTGDKDELIGLPLHGLVKKGFVEGFKTIVNQNIKVSSDQVMMNVKCLQTDYKNDLPDSSKKSISLLQLIAASDKADPFLEYLPVKALVDIFMWKYGYIMLSLRILQFLFFLIAMTFSLVLAAGLPNPNVYDSSPLSVWRALCDFYFLVSGLMNSFFELIEFCLIWKHHFNITRISRGSKLNRYGMFSNIVALAFSYPPTLFDYATDWYNWIDFCSGITLLLYIPLRLTNKPFQWVMASLVYFFSSTLIFKYLTVSPFATYIQIVLSTLTKDLPKFILTFIFPILTFGGAFFISLRYTGSNVMTNETLTASHEEIQKIFLVDDSTYWNTLLAEIRILVEQGSVIKTFYLLDLHWISAIYLFVFTFFTLLVVRAIFIAQLSNTYARSRSQADKIATKFRLDFLARLMGHGSIVSVLFNVKKRFYTEEITLSRKNLQNSFDSDYQRYYGDSALHNRELREDILQHVSALIAIESAKQRDILNEILKEIRSPHHKTGSALDVSLHSPHPATKEDLDS